MKARVIATGEIIEVKVYNREHRLYIRIHGEKTGEIYRAKDLDFNNLDTPDYWTRLEHTYAGMAMQGLSEKYFKEYRDDCAGFGDMDEDEAKGAMEDFANAMADVCYYFAHALVEKMKEERN